MLAATDQRLTEQTDSFADVYDFVARVRRLFPNIDFGRHAGPLFEQLRPLRLVSLDSVRRNMAVPEPLAEHATEQLRALSISLRERGDTRFELEENSSDLLLVALLPRIARHVVNSQLADLSSGAVRIRWIAERFLEVQSKSQTGSQ